MTITFEPVDDDRRTPLPLLLLADGSETIVMSHLERGMLFAIRDGEADVGVLLLIHEGDAVEVKNLAVAEGSRGRGIGRRALAFAARWAREAGADRLAVGTPTRASTRSASTRGPGSAGPAGAGRSSTPIRSRSGKRASGRET